MLILKSLGTLLNPTKERDIYMWSNFVDRLTDIPTLTCTILSFVIPLAVYKINKIFHKNTDPPWKRDETDT